MNIAKAILLKLASALLFALMSALVRYVGESVPLGQVVFFRSACAILPVVLIYAWRGELGAAVRTTRPLGHAGRGLISVVGMFLNFAASSGCRWSMPPPSPSRRHSLPWRSRRSSSASMCASTDGRQSLSAFSA